jgi:hypothetical protein
MDVSRPWRMLIALAEVVQGLICLLTLTMLRPAWATDLRIAGLAAMAKRLEAENEKA